MIPLLLIIAISSTVNGCLLGLILQRLNNPKQNVVMLKDFKYNVEKLNR